MHDDVHITMLTPASSAQCHFNTPKSMEMYFLKKIIHGKTLHTQNHDPCHLTHHRGSAWGEKNITVEWQEQESHSVLGGAASVRLRRGGTAIHPSPICWALWISDDVTASRKNSVTITNNHDNVWLFLMGDYSLCTRPLNTPHLPYQHTKIHASRGLLTEVLEYSNQIHKPIKSKTWILPLYVWLLTDDLQYSRHPTTRQPCYLWIFLWCVTLVTLTWNELRWSIFKCWNYWANYQSVHSSALGTPSCNGIWKHFTVQGLLCGKRNRTLMDCH